MVIDTIGMVSQLCFVEAECSNVLDDYYWSAEALALNSTANATVNKALVTHNFIYEDLAFAIMCVITIVFGIVLNIFTIIVLVTGRQNSKGVRIQLINLAIADCLWAIIGPLIFFHIRFEIPLTSNLFLCKLSTFLGFLAVTVSPLCNVAISIDRFVVVYFPMKVMRYRKRHKVMVAIAVWIISVVIDMGALFNAHLLELNGKVWCFCSPIRYSEPFTMEMFYIISAAKYGLPAVIIVLMYSLIAVKLLGNESVGAKTESTKCQQRIRHDKMVRGTVKVLCTDALFTLMTWLPFTAFQLFSTNYVLNGTVDILDDVSTVTTYYRIQGALICALLTNCFSSPIIYFCVNANFRKDSLALMVRCGCRCFNRYIKRKQMRTCITSVNSDITLNTIK